MTINSLLSAWRTEPSIADCVEVWRTLPRQAAQYSPFPDDLHPNLITALQLKGIQALYAHQLESWNRSKDRENLVVVTGTASGKTLCYNLPVLDLLMRDPQARALYLFPTRALAQDQRASLLELAAALPYEQTSSLAPSVYDGDTPGAWRPEIRRKARIIYSNPDMLHTGILPHHTSWAEFFQNLRFVVIDEMHAYRGVFGSHVANVLRRLKRVSEHYGSKPQFILTSATIANPQQLAENLIEEPVTIIDQDGAARGTRHFLIYNPPIVNKELGLRRSALQECVRLAQDLLAYQVQTIVFGRSRRTVELILTYLRQRTGESSELLDSTGMATQGSIRGYRSGYLPGQRRTIERDLRQGNARLVVATNALELGIDIGKMGAALLVGYPGTIASTWQQAGRAGRGDESSLAVFIATADPLDQFLARHSEYLFEHPPENGLINPDNLLILLDHLRCAAFELPFNEGNSFGRLPASQVNEFLQFLQDAGSLHHSGDRYFWMSDGYPAQSISLRSASADQIVLQWMRDDGPEMIGQVDRASAYWMVHPGAVYIHEAQTYFVDELDLEHNIAALSRVDMDYYTEPRQESAVSLVEKFDEVTVQGAIKAYGDIRIVNQVIGYKRLRWYTHELIGHGDVTLPPTELLTTGYWVSLNEETLETLREQGLWRGDPNAYGRSWPRQRDLARARDRYTCQNCGAVEAERSHDVHHKIPFRSFRDERGIIDSDAANRLDNLITLCQTCHKRAETAVRVRSGLAGLAFTLRHLTPLYLMCDARDLGVHSDPQSPLASKQPVIVIYDQIPAGIGFSQRLFELHDDIMAHALTLISGCGCEDGCPSCVGPGGESGTGGKQETLAILKALVGV